MIEQLRKEFIAKNEKNAEFYFSSLLISNVHSIATPVNTVPVSTILESCS